MKVSRQKKLEYFVKAIDVTQNTYNFGSYVSFRVFNFNAF